MTLSKKNYRNSIPLKSERSAYAMVMAAKNDPIHQSKLLQRYLKRRDEQKQALVNLCSPRCIEILQEYDPECLEGLV
jgi:hypothetical protein